MTGLIVNTSASRQVGSSTSENAYRTAQDSASATYSWGGSFAVAASGATDIIMLNPGVEGRTVAIRRLTIKLVAPAGAVADVPVSIISRGTADTGGTSVAQTAGKRDLGAPNQSVQMLLYSANPSALGASNGVLAYGETTAGTTAAASPELVFDFTEDEGRLPVLRTVWGGSQTARIAVNLGGANLGAGARCIVNIVFSEEPLKKVVPIGDSLVSNATTWQGLAASDPGVMGVAQTLFAGSNGKRLLDFLPTAEANTSGLTWPFSTVMNTLPTLGSTTSQPLVFMHYITNDIRQGACSLAEGIALMDAFLYIMQNGCTSGQSWTSTKSGTPRVFTWNATLTARPNVRIYLVGPNSYLSDDPTSGNYIVNTGFIAAPTLAGACQKATDLAYNIYEAFRGDSRLNGGGVLQCQDFVSPSTGLSFGRTCVPFAQNPLMTDTLHPNAAGQTVKYEMISRAIRANL